MTVDSVILGVMCDLGHDCMIDMDYYEFGLYVPHGIHYPTDLFELKEDVMVRYFNDVYCVDEDGEGVWYIYHDLRTFGKLENVFNVDRDNENTYIRGGDVLLIKALPRDLYIPSVDIKVSREIHKHKEALINYNLFR